MSDKLDEVLYDFQLRAFGEELTRVNGLSTEQRRAYVRSLWESRVKRAASSAEGTAERRTQQSASQFYQED